MNILITPSQVSGLTKAPPSKSYSHRAIILASLACGKSTIKNLLLSKDTLLTIEACKKLGAKIKLAGSTAQIVGNNGSIQSKRNTEIWCGESGTTARFLTGFCALCRNETIIDGAKRLRERPMRELIYALKKQGVKIVSLYKTNHLPLKIKGGSLNGGKLIIENSPSSQFISSLLLIAPFAKNDTSFYVLKTKSSPYIDITLDLMEKFGVTVLGKENIYFIKSGQRYRSINYSIEGDYSSAAYFLASAAITRSKITVCNLNQDSKQGDKFFLTILKNMGCLVEWNDNKVTVTGGNLKGINIDMSNYPDLVPILCAVASYAKTKTLIYNIENLKDKESNRIKSIASGLKKMGVFVETGSDYIQVSPNVIKGTTVESHNDHRIAMSLAVVSLGAYHKTVIKNANVVDKSYPKFWDDFKKIGVVYSIYNL